MAQRWQRRKQARAPEILDAALACFAQKGFAATRLDDIAARAGITKGTIYLYFDSKQALFEALTRQSIGQQLDAVKAQLAAFTGSSADLLRLVLTTMGHFAMTSDRVVLPRLVLAEAANFPQLAEFWRREIIERGIGIFISIIQRGIASGEFRKIEPQHAARLCVAPILVILLWRTTFAQFDDQPYDYQGLIEAHLQTLLNGLKAP
ncbi:MAG TPA: TetR/AcrR family transcriptional regulator [Rhizomicrobium sp.]|nr:TetR/AcrR family transcriptional regulator [Rhizomicrobium sp.]